jgi:hypothetical protein
MTTPKVNWSERDQMYWVATDAEPLWFESSLEAQHAARQIEIDNAVKAERAAVVAWLRSEAAYDLASQSEHGDLLALADAIENEEHLK